MKIKSIKIILKERKYFNIFLISFFLYLGLCVYLIYYFYNGFTQFLNYPVKYYPIASIIFSFTLSFLFGINITLIIHDIKTKSKFGIFAIFTSFFTAGCPLCSLSILSLLIPSLGLTFLLVLLPFKGLEIQLLGILLLTLSIYITKENKICKK